MEWWRLLLCGLGVAVFLEGLPYFVSPGAVRRYLRQIAELGDGAMRAVGLAMMAVGLATAYLVLH